MVSINTEQLRKQADNLTGQSRRFARSQAALEEVLVWMKQQEFKDVGQLIRGIEQQREALEEQRSRMLLLADALQRICDKYDSTGQKLVDIAEISPGISGCIEKVDLDYINKFVMVYGGLHLT